MERIHYLSKSKILSGWQCPKRLWLEKSQPDLVDYSDATLAAFAIGNEVGDIAQALFPGGYLIKHDDELSEALRETEQLLAEPGRSRCSKPPLILMGC